MDSDYDDPGPDNTLGHSGSLDSDDVRNDDGDVVVDAPNQLDRGRRASEHRAAPRGRNSTTPDTATGCARRGGTAAR